MRELGEYVREQRENAHLSVRQLSAVAGISNPYLSQIERGLRRPSAEILNSLAKGLQISAESLYVRAGLLDDTRESSAVDVRLALSLDRHLTDRQRRIMLDLYDSFVPSAPTTGVRDAHVGASEAEGMSAGGSVRRRRPTAKPAPGMTDAAGMTGIAEATEMAEKTEQGPEPASGSHHGTTRVRTRRTPGKTETKE